MTCYMKEIIKMLGVKLEKEFCITGFPKDVRFKFTEDGLYYYNEEQGWWEGASYIFTRLLVGEAKIVASPWKPDDGESYYVPNLSAEEKYCMLTWCHSSEDKLQYQRGLVCKTKEEAVKMTNSLLESVQPIVYDEREDN